jgi:hypothetical protein
MTKPCPLRIPVYGFSSMISLNSEHLSFYIDTIRDIYEVHFILSKLVHIVGVCDLLFLYATSKLFEWRKKYHHNEQRQTSNATSLAV